MSEKKKAPARTKKVQDPTEGIMVTIEDVLSKVVERSRSDTLYVLRLMELLGEHVGLKIEKRQTDQGAELYWRSRSGRILKP